MEKFPSCQNGKKKNPSALSIFLFTFLKLICCHLACYIHGTWKQELNKAYNEGLLALFTTSVVLMFRGAS